METAFGACLAGKRSFCGMKHVGLKVAADPLFTVSYTGVNAGMVIGVADDAGMHSSQNEQDSRHYARSAKLPMLEPADSGEARAFAMEAYALSEKFDCPVLLKMCTGWPTPSPLWRPARAPCRRRGPMRRTLPNMS
jgi:indolepyruvate ferredoxin oxidoreductase alpha subunit